MVLNLFSNYSLAQLRLRLVWLVLASCGLLGLASEACRQMLPIVVPVRLD
ncbi:MAG: hypothetical protein HC860_18235 [Alkalinema sp. RU_4_3]|nr:hypothetical protein [Alkalinema sp. RU_4_3]